MIPDVLLRLRRNGNGSSPPRLFHLTFENNVEKEPQLVNQTLNYPSFLRQHFNWTPK